MNVVFDVCWISFALPMIHVGNMKVSHGETENSFNQIGCWWSHMDFFQRKIVKFLYLDNTLGVFKGAFFDSPNGGFLFRECLYGQ